MCHAICKEILGLDLITLVALPTLRTIKVRKKPTFKKFINYSVIGFIVNYQLREGRRLLTKLSSWVCSYLSALSHSVSTLSHSYDWLLYHKGIERAISLPDLLSLSLSPAGFSAHFLHNCVKNEAWWVSRIFPPFREGLVGGTPC